MRLHTSLTETELYCAMIDVGTDVYLDYTRHGSRSHERAFEVSLTGFGARHTRAKNTGTVGAFGYGERAATWSDWGRFIAGVFERDPSAKCAYYADAADYHAKTHGLFAPGAVVTPRTLAAEVRDVRTDGHTPTEAIERVARRHGLHLHVAKSAIFGE